MKAKAKGIVAINSITKTTAKITNANDGTDERQAQHLSERNPLKLSALYFNLQTNGVLSLKKINN